MLLRLTEMRNGIESLNRLLQNAGLLFSDSITIDETCVVYNSGFLDARSLHNAFYKKQDTAGRLELMA